MNESRFRQIFLIGFMGAGKSTIGPVLAQRLGWKFVDLDSQIEARCRLSIPRIFAERGEEWFRQQEHDALAAIPSGLEAVVAVGGGALQRPDNRRLIRQRGVTVWLDAPFSLILQRLGDSGRLKRPLFVNQQEARLLYERRRPLYARADYVIRVSAESEPDEVTRDIEDWIGNPSCAI